MPVAKKRWIRWLVVLLVVAVLAALIWRQTRPQPIEVVVRPVEKGIVERTAANTLRQGGAALTGPLARGERGTIARDLEGLDGDPFRDVYLAVADAAGRTEVEA